MTPQKTSSPWRKALQLAGLGLLCWSLGAGAQAADAQPTYAVLSLIGDQLTTVRQTMTTGSNLDKNVREQIAMKDKSLDKLTLMSAVKAINAVRPSADPVLLMVNDPTLYELQSTVFSDDPEAAKARAGLQGTLRQAKASQLILITKFRGEATVKLLRGHTGSGKLSGLGFFMERKDMINEDTLVKSSGYLAPFAYLRVSLVDVESMQVLSEAVATESKIAPLPMSATSSNLWDALDSNQKVQVLGEVINDSLAKAMPQVLAQH